MSMDGRINDMQSIAYGYNGMIGTIGTMVSRYMKNTFAAAHHRNHFHTCARFIVPIVPIVP